MTAHGSQTVERGSLARRVCSRLAGVGSTRISFPAPVSRNPGELSRLVQEEALLRREVRCPFQTARACKTEVGAQGVAHRVDEGFGATRREAVLPPDVEYLHARVGTID